METVEDCWFSYFEFFSILEKWWKVRKIWEFFSIINLILFLVTEQLIRKKSEHNELLIFNLEEISLHQENIEKIEHIQDWCRELRILLLQSNLIWKIGKINQIYICCGTFSLIRFSSTFFFLFYSDGCRFSPPTFDAHFDTIWCNSLNQKIFTNWKNSSTWILL